jgi:hypothetical protein
MGREETLLHKKLIKEKLKEKIKSIVQENEPNIKSERSINCNQHLTKYKETNFCLHTVL